MDKPEEIVSVLALELRRIFDRAELSFAQLQEIRLRTGQPLVILYQNQEWYLSEEGKRGKRREDACRVSAQWIRETMEYISNYSLYACEEEIRKGYLTIRGGHRVGIAGKAVVEEDQIKQITDISFLNIRLSHEVIGCGRQAYSYIVQNGEVYNTLIISSPRCGKTTLLRDLIRLISNGMQKEPGHTVAVVDERSELGASYQGVPQNDLGIRTDVLDNCPKAEGMMMMIRSMAPEVVAVDEIGGSRDVEALRYAMRCGCALLATIHGAGMEDVRNRPVIQSLVDMHMFKRYIVLKTRAQIGQIAFIYDDQGNCLYGREQEAV